MLTKHAISSALLLPVSINAFDTVSLRTVEETNMLTSARGMLPLYHTCAAKSTLIFEKEVR